MAVVVKEFRPRATITNIEHRATNIVYRNCCRNCGVISKHQKLLAFKRER